MERNMVGNEDDVDPDRGNGPDGSAAAALNGNICGEEVIPAAMLKSKEYIPQKIKHTCTIPLNTCALKHQLKSNLFPAKQQTMKQTTLFF
eukprot:6342243-Ditylum_brightwellii.AAC.1